MKKIDMHAHVTNRKVEKVLAQDCSLKSLEKEMEKYGINQSVVLATYFPHKQSGISNFRMYHWIKDNPKFLMFGSLDFEHYYFQGLNELNELAEMGALAGIKIYTCYQNIDVKSEKFVNLVDFAKKNSLPMAFHTGYSFSSMRKYHKPTITKMFNAKDLEFLAKENPEVNFLACHMSKPSLDELIDVVKKNPNVYTDMSGLFHSGDKDEEETLPQLAEEIKKFLNTCGCKRLMFGTDFPVQSHGDSIYLIEEAMKDFSYADKEDVYYNNARRFLGK